MLQVLLLILSSRPRPSEGLPEPPVALLFRNAMFDRKYVHIDIPASIYLTIASCLCGPGGDASHQPTKEPGGGSPRRCLAAGIAPAVASSCRHISTRSAPALGPGRVTASSARSLNPQLLLSCSNAPGVPPSPGPPEPRPLEGAWGLISS